MKDRTLSSWRGVGRWRRDYCNRKQINDPVQRASVEEVISVLQANKLKGIYFLDQRIGKNSKQLVVRTY